MEHLRTRLAVDIGGTFTDVVLDQGGRQTSRKVLTTPSRPADGFMTGVEAALASTATAPSDVDLIVHGTTLATNALIERKGAKTVLIVTEGHRDSLEMAYENRFHQYDIEADRRPPLVPRTLRWPVGERMDSKGRVLDPLDESCVRALLPRISDEGIESVAVGLLHAYANPVHERQVAEILASAHPDLSLSLSSDVCPEIREFERQSTTAANAYVRPVISRYLEDLRARLASAGFRCPCLLMTSGGSLITIETAARYPVRLIESGPAGGAILASHVARQLGLERVLSFDMGGTTAKICLIDDGEPLLARTFEVDRAHRFMKGSGLPVKIPVVEMVEIGAGGGSIASLDGLGRLQVGPESAGADPGPACYGRGGDRPTVTDADLLIGRIDAVDFAGGGMPLDGEAARIAVARGLGDALGPGSVDAALGIVEIVDEAMAGAARVHAAERGRDLAQRTMIAFGGAAPLHAARLAEKIGITRVIVPADAGVGSAVGFLLAPVAYEVVRSLYERLSTLEVPRLDALFEEMAAEAEAVVRLAAPDQPLIQRRYAFARYVGQGHEIKVPVPEGPLDPGVTKAIREAFEEEYSRQYGRTVPGLEVEVLTWSATVSAPAVAADRVPDTGLDVVVKDGVERRPAYFPGFPGPVEAAVHRRAALEPGMSVRGPAALTEEQTTTMVPPGALGRVNGRGDLMIDCEAERPARAGSAALQGGIRRQVIWDRLIATVEEQAQALIRTAFSTTVREAGDLSAGVFDRRGRMLAQAVTGTPGHVNAMAASVRYFLERFPIDTMVEGDVYATNDPWLGTGHLFDFTVVTPVFRAGRPVGVFASTVHVVDIGGPGFGPDAGQVFEEGLCIPILPLFKGGTPNESLFEIVRANVREPVQVVGDLYSLAASNAVGGRRLLEMMDAFALDGLEEIGDHIIEASRSAMLREIRALPRGRYRYQMTVDGYDAPITLAACLSVEDDGIDVDFSGTSAVSPFGINVPLSYTQAYASFGVRCVVGNAVPNNAGSLAPVRVSAPEGSILNAPRPCAVAVRHVVGQMLPDVVLGCLDQAIPGRVPAEGSSSLWNPMLSGGHGVVGNAGADGAEPFSVTIFHSGGAGARPGKPGLSATAFPSGVRNTPVEVTEAISPLLYRRKEYRSGSGGVGRFQGGEGQVIELEHAAGVPFAVFALFDRIDHPARGRNGGGAGAPGAIRLASGRRLKGKGKQVVPAGDRLILELPGGGGIGTPDDTDLAPGGGGDRAV